VVSRRVRRRRRQFATVGGLLFLFLIYSVFISGGTKKPAPPAAQHTHQNQTAFPAHSPLNPEWKGDGKAVTLAFGGDVHFAGAVGARLTQDPATALGNTPAQLFAGAQLRMVNLETALTAGQCPQVASKQYHFYAPPSAFTALNNATVTVGALANDHALDCGITGLDQGLAAAKSAGFPLIGAGDNAAQAFAPYRVTINGQRIAVIAATQIIQPSLISAWTATSAQPGVASALDPTELVRAVQDARRTADTVVVYMHWGTETVACPNPQQEPLAQQLVQAGADVVIGADAHVLSGAGYLGDAYIDYGLGNFAFYDNAAPETDSGALLITVEGRHIVSTSFRPATILSGLPQPLTGAPAATALQNWNAARACTNLAASPTFSLATESGETVPFTAPATTTTTAPTTAGGATTTSTTTAPSTTTQPTDNAG
jgi:poly-gamma-glutamate capsule biosynthesis protein CapA/YwtB (metallophosphatase superfamily)